MPLPTASPEQHGLRSADLLHLIDSLENAGLDPHALTVIRGGHVLFRGAWQPWAMHQPALVYSVSKTFTALAIGFLEAEGLVDVSAPVDRYLDTPNPHGITVRHLLTMNTGHSREQTLELSFDIEAVLTIPAAHAPGASFAYNSPATYALSAIVTTVSGLSLTEYLTPRLFEPLGITPRWWMKLDDLEQGFSGLHLNVDDLSRIGIALADEGRFGGRQVIPEAFIADATHPWSDTTDEGGGDWALGYGYQLWRSRYGFRLDGAFGQFVLVVPERNIVIAYQGATTDTGAVLDAFWRLVDVIDNTAVADDASATAALATRAARLDSWDARATLSVTTPVEDPTGWALVDTESGQWELMTPYGVITVRADGWQRTVVGDGDELLVLVTRGEQRADGSVLVHVVVPTSPHRLIVTRGGDGLHIGWHIAPLWRASLTTLLVPPLVAESR
ncbi:serine hydrolase domain-containing protein [Microbacterium sp. A93]|uniref:serine hydrolase domain-containing protein n=1 Tax=Microbacterium sp. A93 TaxID=3450716 RepID=UPI003F444CD0